MILLTERLVLTVELTTLRALTTLGTGTALATLRTLTTLAAVTALTTLRTLATLTAGRTLHVALGLRDEHTV